MNEKGNGKKNWGLMAQKAAKGELDEDVRALLLSAEPSNLTGGFVAEKHADKRPPVKLSPYWITPFKATQTPRLRAPSPAVGAAPAGRGAAAAAEIRRRYNAATCGLTGSSSARNRSPPKQRSVTPGADWRLGENRPASAQGVRKERAESACQVCGHVEPDVASEVGIPAIVRRQLEAHLKYKCNLKPGEALILVEHCHQCEEHNTISLRHDEQKYKITWCAVQDEVKLQYPTLGCYPMACCLSRGAKRIGAFEVYLCCKSPALLSGAVELQGGYVVKCLFSKLKGQFWPEPKYLTARLSEELPEVPVRIIVKTTDDRSVTGIIVRGRQLKNDKNDDQPEDPDKKREVFVQTDSTGVCEVWAQVCSSLALDVHHPIIMQPQQKKVGIITSACEVHFTAETVAEIWQLKTADVLIVYAAPPQLGTAIATGQKRVAHPPREGLEHFQGYFETEDGSITEMDSAGCLRCMGDPLAGLQDAFCTGWQSAPVNAQAIAAGGLLELARLRPPNVEISVVTACCSAPVPGARVFVDGDAVGYTGSQGSYEQPLAAGAHSVRVEHALCPEGQEAELLIEGSMTCGLQIKINPSELKLVCTELCEDVLEVRLTLARRAEAYHTQALDGTVTCGDRSCQVRAGRLHRDQFGFLQDEALDESIDESSRKCPLSNMVLEEVTSEAEYWPILARQPVSGCALVRAADGSFPVIGQLVRKVEREPNEGVRIRCKGSCCSLPWEGVKVCVDGDVDRPLYTSEYGDVDVDCEEFDRLVKVSVGNSNAMEADMCLREQWSARVHVLFSCQLYIYMLDPEEEDDEECASEPGDARPPPKLEATVWVCGNEDSIPDEARPVKGVLHTPGARIPEQRLQGERFGPLTIIRYPDDDPDQMCVLADASFVPEQGSYRAKDPSPLSERCAYFGGCEFQRLLECPVVMGFLSSG